MDKVYIVFKGERYEGGGIISVHQSFKSAKVAALKLVENDVNSYNAWRHVKANTWLKGPEFVEIIKSEILK